MCVSARCLVFIAGCGLSVCAFAQGVPVYEGGTQLEARVAQLERLIQNQGLFDLVNQIEAVQREVQQLRGDLETQSHLLEQLEQRQRDLYVDLDRRLQSLAQGPGAVSSSSTEPSPVPQVEQESIALVPEPESPESMEGQPRDRGTSDAASVAPPTPSAEDTPQLPGDPNSEHQIYREAFALLKSGQYKESIPAFTRFLQMYPNSAYADNAQYWLGEAYYVMREFSAAIKEYEKLPSNYAASPKVSHALLKIGYSYHELGELGLALDKLEALRNQFPGTTAAQLAEGRLQQIRRAQPQ